MMELDAQTFLFLILSVGIALGFEFINGFHDTANAVATVIYTKSLKPRLAVVLSGCCNFLGVYIGGIAVAYAIVHLLPVDLLVSVNNSSGMIMIYALLLAAMLWNFGTWYLGLPASSSHTLIGSIIGVGLVHALIEGMSVSTGVNWAKAFEVFLSLLISPVLGFLSAWLLLKALQRFAPDPTLHKAPEGETPPPFWIRMLLVLTCTGVSFAHGSNDGQKGVGLIMLILIGILPAHYALNQASDQAEINTCWAAAANLQNYVNTHREIVDQAIAKEDLSLLENQELEFPINCGVQHALDAAANIAQKLGGLTSFSDLKDEDRWSVRTDILCLADAVTKFLKIGTLPTQDRDSLTTWLKQLRSPTEYAPDWVLIAVATALGLGTMIGWKRIVVTIGEKIGKTHMTYAQGASAQAVAMATIGLADVMGLPVSTTHVLSSGVAGTMAAGKSGLQMSTLRSIALAWVLTLPAAMIIAGGLYYLFHVFFS
ncbi:MAG: inorganic phosphate transporter [Desulfovibrionaceae bacterium]